MTSGSEETNNKSTNPSSQNSSFDHIQQVHKPQVFNSEYNSHFAPVSAPQQTGFMNNPNGHQVQAGPSYDTSPPTNGFNYPPRQQQQPGSMGPPVAPPNNPRVPIKLNSGTSGAADDYGFAELEKSTSGKRKSWLKRAFSKREK